MASAKQYFVGLSVACVNNLKELCQRILVASCYLQIMQFLL